MVLHNSRKKKKSTSSVNIQKILDTDFSPAKVIKGLK